MVELIVYATIAIAHVVSADRPTVQIDNGQLLGEFWSSQNGRQFEAYTSIPFAKPPVGRLRFQPPQDADPWPEPRDSADYPHVECAQMTFSEEVTGIEDCLYLNVYTPTAGNSTSHPVMVFIHGGGFFTGSASTFVYGPEYFLDEDVVLVTFNYRLGPLGFWTLEDKAAPGNVGLMDQIKALEWVQQNIARFGGDPDRVTVFGESAGGMSVGFLLLSPRAKGLFHAAIVLSGPLLSSFTHWDKKPKLYGRRFAQHLGCSQEDPEDVIQCLQALPASTFPEEVKLFLHFPWTGPSVWMPIVDGHFADDPILPQDPETMLETGHYQRVPMIIGSNSDEGAFNLIPYLTDIASLDEVDDRWDELGPLILFHRSLDERSADDITLAKKVKAFYFEDHESKIGHNNIEQFVKLMGDHMFISGTDRMIRKMISADRGADLPVYRYLYTHTGSLTTVDPFLLGEYWYQIKVMIKFAFGVDVFNANLGVAHADELFVLFRPHALPFHSLLTEEDKLVSQRMVRIFANFASSLDPNPLPGFVKWPSVQESSPEMYLNISAAEELSIGESEDFRTRNAFWNDVWDELRLKRNFLSSKPPLTASELEEMQSSNKLSSKDEL